MHEGNRTEISTLGEFGLIKHLTDNIKLVNSETKYGIGDDAAVLEYQDRQVLVTTDLLMEGVHFDLVYTPLKHLGYKSAMVNFSDQAETDNRIISSIQKILYRRSGRLLRRLEISMPTAQC